MQKYLPLLFCLFIFFTSKSQGLLNDGATIVIAASTSVYVSGGTTNGNYTNQTNGSNGSIDIDGNLYVEGNWNNNAGAGNVFINVDADGTVYLNGASAQTIGGSRATSFENLNISSADKTLGITGSSVKGTLTVDAVLDLNSKTFLIDNSANTAITLTSDYIKSENAASRLQWNMRTTIASYTIPFKKDASTDLTITLNKTSAGTESGTGQIEFYTFPTNDLNVPLAPTVTHVGYASQNVIDRFWGINSSGYSAAPASDLTLQYDVTDLVGNPGLVEADLFMQRFNVAGSYWEAGGGTINTGSDNILRAITSYGVYTLTKSTSPLPIDLASFSLNCREEEKMIDIEWTTASETNNNYFTIEKSNDGIVYEKLADIPSLNGNSNSFQTYTYIDSMPFNGTTYYQLKQTDYNEDSQTFGPYEQSCILETGQPEVYNVFYNTESHSLTFDMNSPSDEPMSFYVSCYDVKGQKLVQEIYSANKGQNTLSLQTNNLSRGIYFISFFNEAYSGAKKFVVSY